MNRDELLAFLVDLTSPIGPEVLAGFGTEIENRRADDLFAYFDIIEEWSARVKVEDTLTLLFDIALEPPDVSLINNYYGRFQEAWNHTLVDLVYAVGKRDAVILEKTIEQYKDYQSLADFIAELQSELSGADKISR